MCTLSAHSNIIILEKLGEITMKKFILGTLALSAIACADTATVLPYFGTINYDNSAGKSLKDSSKFGGVYTSIGNLDYLLEFSYNYLDTRYKDNVNVSNLIQHDVTLVYSKYNPKYMFKGGIHYINNNENANFRDLGSGIVGILGVEGYTYRAKSKISYGLDVYYSHYGSAHNETTINDTTTISLWQFTPYFSYGKTISADLGNTFTLKANFIDAKDYLDSSYFSYEISDTVTYKGAYLTLGYMGGDMKSGVRDNGFSVYNTKDLYHRSYQAKLGYYFTPKLNISINYTANDYEEYNAATLQLLPEGRNSIVYAAVSYTF